MGKSQVACETSAASESRRRWARAIAQVLPCYLFRVGPVLELGLLGPFEVRIDDGAPVALGGVRQRALLAVLALHANQVVSTDRLIDELWGEHPPSTAVHTVQVFVSRSAQRAGRGRGASTDAAAGYVLELDADELDAGRCERLYDSARVGARRRRRRAERRCSTPGLVAWSSAGRFHLRAIRSSRDRPPRGVEAELPRGDSSKLNSLWGRHQQLVPELEAFVREQPLRERARGQLMLALYRCGRQAEALEDFREARQKLIDELGVEPGAALRELHEAILRQDASLDCPTPRPKAPGRSWTNPLLHAREPAAPSVRIRARRR